MDYSMTNRGNISSREDLVEKTEDKVELHIRKRMGFFGFALGVALYSFLIVISPLFPYIPFMEYVLWFLFPRYPFPWNYIMVFVTLLIWGSILYSVPYNKSKF